MTQIKLNLDDLPKSNSLKIEFNGKEYVVHDIPLKKIRHWDNIRKQLKREEEVQSVDDLQGFISDMVNIPKEILEEMGIIQITAIAAHINKYIEDASSPNVPSSASTTKGQ